MSIIRFLLGSVEKIVSIGNECAEGIIPMDEAERVHDIAIHQDPTQRKNCSTFAPIIPVLMPAVSKLVPMSDIRAGDWVWEE